MRTVLPVLCSPLTFVSCVFLTAQDLQIGKVLASLKYSYENNSKLSWCPGKPHSGFDYHCIYFCCSRKAGFGPVLQRPFQENKHRSKFTLAYEGFLPFIPDYISNIVWRMD